MQELIIKEIIKNFSKTRIGVIGDLMLDQFIFGDTERISPEAPVPIVRVTKETYFPGGAGNVAANAAGLKGTISVAGVAGNDIAGKCLLKELKKRNISIEGVITAYNKPTVQKTRIISRSQHILRMDKELNSYIDSFSEKKILDYVSKNISNWDAVVISDYAKGLVTKKLAGQTITLARKYQKPIIVDTKPKHFSYFKNATIITPNEKEAKEMANCNDIKKAGKFLQKKLNCNVLITQGSNGMTLFQNNTCVHIPATAKKVCDVTGAGDTVVALLALCLALKMSLKDASYIANQAAGIAVTKLGTSIVLPEELEPLE